MQKKLQKPKNKKMSATRALGIKLAVALAFFAVCVGVAAYFFVMVPMGDSLGYTRLDGQSQAAATSARTTQKTSFIQKLFGTRTKATTTAVALTGNAVPPPAPLVITPKNSLGIAAGGAPIYLGQPELDAYFQKLSDLGVGWVRWDIAWNVVQSKSADQYDWSGVDRVVATAQKYKIKSLGIITYAPTWAAQPNGCTDSMCTPNDPAQFGKFAGLVAARYAGSMDYFEIWNEPNYTQFWKPTPSIPQYIAILKSGYTEIKKANPNAIVIAGAFAAQGDEADGSISPVTFTQALYEAHAQSYFDALSMHPYTYPASPTYVASWNAWLQIATVRQLMVNNGDSAKKIWLTEYGAPTGGLGQSRTVDTKASFVYGSDYMSEAAQQQLAQAVIDQYQKNRSYLGPFFWYSLQDEGTGNTTPENFFGILRYDGSKKPSYDVFRNAVVSGLVQ